MAEYEEKFIVINRKHLKELAAYDVFSSNTVFDLNNAVKRFLQCYEGRMKKKIDQKYYVCNQDEPYAQKVIDTIIEGETSKEIEDKFKDIEIGLTHRRV